MKWLLLSAVLMAVPVQGDEAAPPSVREKLRTRIVESLPRPPATAPVETRPEREDSVLVLAPMVVSESRGVRELEKTLADGEQRKEAERFSVVKGGTIYRSDRVELGSWWSPATGWQILKFKW